MTFPFKFDRLEGANWRTNAPEISLRLVMERGLGVKFDALVQKPVQNKTRQK